MSSVGIPWIDKSDYAKLREIFTDGHLLPEKFEYWQGRFEEATKVYEAINGKVVRVRLSRDHSLPAACSKP